jgi:hypothetical protein
VIISILVAPSVKSDKLPPSSLIVSVSEPAPPAKTSVAANESSKVVNESSPAPAVTESTVELAAIFLYEILFAALKPPALTVDAPPVAPSRIVSVVDPFPANTSLDSVKVLAPVPVKLICSIPLMFARSEAATIVVAASLNTRISATPAPPITVSAEVKPIKSDTSSTVKISLPAPPSSVSIPQGYRGTS